MNRWTNIVAAVITIVYVIGGGSGTCNGDAGGPVFLGGFDSNLIVGITFFGLNELCRGTDFAYRIDTPEVLAWIESYL